MVKEDWNDIDQNPPYNNIKVINTEVVINGVDGISKGEVRIDLIKPLTLENWKDAGTKNNIFKDVGNGTEGKTIPSNVPVVKDQGTVSKGIIKAEVVPDVDSIIKDNEVDCPSVLSKNTGVRTAWVGTKEALSKDTNVDPGISENSLPVNQNSVTTSVVHPSISGTNWIVLHQGIVPSYGSRTSTQASVKVFSIPVNLVNVRTTVEKDKIQVREILEDITKVAGNWVRAEGFVKEDKVLNNVDFNLLDARNVDFKIGTGIHPGN